MNSTRAGHLAFVVAVTGYCVWLLYDTLSTAQHDASMGAVVAGSVLAVVLGAIIVVREVVAMRLAPKQSGAALPADSARQGNQQMPWLILFCLAGYVAVAILIGLEIATFVSMIVTGRLLGARLGLGLLFYAGATAALLGWMLQAFASPANPVFPIF